VPPENGCKNRTYRANILQLGENAKHFSFIAVIPEEIGLFNKIALFPDNSTCTNP
jgi:hypothetical protein